MHKYLPIEIVFIPNRVFQNFTRSTDPIYFFSPSPPSSPLVSFYFILLFFLFYPKIPQHVRGNLEKNIDHRDPFPSSTLPPSNNRNEMEAENRIFQRGVKKKKVETTGEEGHFHLASGQSASEPRSMIGNLQKSLGGFGSPPLPPPLRIYVVT